MRSFKEAIRPLWPLLAFMVLLLLWPFISPNDIMEKDPRILFMLSGTIFSNISVSLGQFFVTNHCPSALLGLILKRALDMNLGWY